jgi:hypothetical protein
VLSTLVTIPRIVTTSPSTRIRLSAERQARLVYRLRPSSPSSLLQTQQRRYLRISAGKGLESYRFCSGCMIFSFRKSRQPFQAPPHLTKYKKPKATRIRFRLFILWAMRDLNPRPFRCKRTALPTELIAPISADKYICTHDSCPYIWTTVIYIYKIISV